jgi:hypothetical protein
MQQQQQQQQGPGQEEDWWRRLQRQEQQQQQQQQQEQQQGQQQQLLRSAPCREQPPPAPPAVESVRDRVERQVSAALEARAAEDERRERLARPTTPRHARHASQLSQTSQDDAEVLAELELIRNLLAAEQANDLASISSAQGQILSNETLGADVPKVYSPPVQPGKRGPKVSERARALLRRASSLASRRSSGASSSSSTSAASEESESSSEESASEGAAREEPGLEEHEALALAGTAVEREFVERLCAMVQQSAGPSLRSRAPLVAGELEFWALAALRARRFRLLRARQLLLSYCGEPALQAHLALLSPGPFVVEREAQQRERVRALLRRGVVSLVGDARCKQGRGLLLVQQRHHEPRHFAATDVLAAIHLLVVHAVRRSPELQTLGFTIINDMTGVGLRNFDLNVPKLLASTVESKLPMRYGQLILVNPPAFFSVVFSVVQRFLSQKMRARIVKLCYDPRRHVLANPLNQFLRVENLPDTLGGNRQVDFERLAALVLPPEPPQPPPYLRAAAVPAHLAPPPQQQPLTDVFFVSQSSVQFVDAQDDPRFRSDESLRGERASSDDSPPPEPLAGADVGTRGSDSPRRAARTTYSAAV